MFKTYTKIQLENKVQELNDQRDNTIGVSLRTQINRSINYYITKLVKFDENPNLKTIEA